MFQLQRVLLMHILCVSEYLPSAAQQAKSPHRECVGMGIVYILSIPIRYCY